MNKNKHKKVTAISFAVLAAAFYAVNMPFSKLLLESVGATMLAGLLYIGAGIGIGCVYFIRKGKIPAEKKIGRGDIPYAVAMIFLDIAAPILLMLGLKSASAANASLLNNFEIVATTVIAFLFFKEAVSPRLWTAIGLITLSSIILSFEDMSSFVFSWGSLLVLAATVCWGMENNCTRKISDKSAYEIVMLKGLFSGFGSVIIAFMVGEKPPQLKYILFALLLGFVAYGLSITFYVTAQNTLGAAKTSAYYAVAPFIGALLSAVFLRERITAQYLIALAVMLVGSLLAAFDTLKQDNTASI